MYFCSQQVGTETRRVFHGSLLWQSIVCSPSQGERDEVGYYGRRECKGCVYIEGYTYGIFKTENDGSDKKIKLLKYIDWLL